MGGIVDDRQRLDGACAPCGGIDRLVIFEHISFALCSSGMFPCEQDGATTTAGDNLFREISLQWCKGWLDNGFGVFRRARARACARVRARCFSLPRAMVHVCLGAWGGSIGGGWEVGPMIGLRLVRCHV